MSVEAVSAVPLPVDPLTVRPIRVQRPASPDADWTALRDRILAACGSLAPDWSDQNAVDPGTTLAEAGAFALADLHHRTAYRVPAWPMEVPAWLPDAERHWYATLPQGASADLADRLKAPAPPTAGTGSTAAVLEPVVRRCGSPDEAAAVLARAPWAGVFTSVQVPVVIALLRARLVRAVAHERTGLVADAVEEQRGTGDTVAERDTRAAAALGKLMPLWPDELAALVRRERRRLSVETVLDRLSEVAAANTPMAAAAARARLSDPERELTSAEVDAAMAGARTPPKTVPEHIENGDGTTRLWPPHPVQALTCEPVTTDDYARRARSHPQVGRAWAVAGKLPGIGWDGRKATTAESRAGTVTLVVERVSGTGPAARFLREVLATAIGTEVIQPHPTWRDDLDALDPRRVIGDEVGAAILRKVPVVLQGKLITGVDADQAAAVHHALSRVQALFAEGQESRRPAGPGGPAPGAAAPEQIDGPWPRVDQPRAGWTPGDPIRFSDVVEALADDPAVLGVEDLAIGVDDAEPVGSSADSVPMPADAVPWLPDVQCLRVRLVLTAGCGDA